MKMNNPNVQTGFTLIELMITIAMLAVLIMMGTALTRSWVDRSQVNSALATFKTAVYQAKASALRNTNNQPLSNSSVSVCFNSTNNTINIIRTAFNSNDVCTVPTGTPPSNANALIRTMPLSKDIFIQQGTTTFECLSFNSAGVLVKAAGSSCINNVTAAFKVGKNDETAEFNIL